MKPRFLLSVLWLCVLLATAERSGLAQPKNPVGMELASPLAITDKPFSVLTRFRRWFPIGVTLSNSGDPVRGTLTLKLFASGGDTGAVSTFVTEVDLPTVARKRVWLYGRLERGECDQAEVTLRGRGIETLVTRFDLRAPDAGARVVLTISDSDEKLAYLGGIGNRRLGIVEDLNDDTQMPGSAPNIATKNGVNPNATRRWVQALGKGREWIPDRWIGLDAVDAVVLQDFPHTALTPQQIPALRGYVASGGALIVLGGANWQRLATSPLADLWPVTPTASTVASSAEVRSLVANYVTKANLDGGDRLGGAPVLMTRGTLKPGAQFEVGSEKSPLLALNRSGAGQVLFLAVDPTQPPFLGWSGLGELWATVFGKTKRANRLEGVDARLEMPAYSPSTGYGRYGNAYGYEGNGVSEPTTSLWTEMVRSPQLRTPPVSYIAWFLALYVFCLVPVNYCVLRYLDRRELAWVTVPIIVVGFSMMSYFAAVRIKGTVVRTRHVNIVQSSAGSGVARADAMMWLFSPRKSTYSVQGDDPAMIVAPYLDGVRDSNRDEATIVEPADASFQIRDTLVNMWDFKTFVGQSVVGIGGGIAVQPTKTGLQISNNSKTNLQGVVVVSGGRVVAYGDVGAGQSTSKVLSQEGNGNIDPSQMGAIQRASDLNRIFPVDGAGARQNMAKSALSVALGTNYGKSFEGAMLLAWSREAVARVAAQGEAPQGQDVTLWLVRLPENLSIGERKADTSEQASVKLVDIENIGQRRIYEADFATANAPTRSIEVRVRGAFEDQNYMYGNRYNRRYNPRTGQYDNQNWSKTAPLTRVEAWNFSTRQWQAIGTQSKATKAGRQWSWSSRVDGSPLRNLVREDGTMRLRFGMPHQMVRIQAVRVERR